MPTDLDLHRLLAPLDGSGAPNSPPTLPEEREGVVLLARHRAPPDDVARTRGALEERVGAATAKTLLERMIPVTVRAGRDLLVHEERADALYFLCEGAMEVRLELEGCHLELGRVEAGAWLGEVNLIDGGPASATVRVTRDARLMRLTRDDLAELRTSHPRAALDLLRSVNRDLAHRVRRCSAGLVHRLQDGGFRMESAADQRLLEERLLAGLVLAELSAA